MIRFISIAMALAWIAGCQPKTPMSASTTPSQEKTAGPAPAATAKIMREQSEPQSRLRVLGGKGYASDKQLDCLPKSEPCLVKVAVTVDPVTGRCRPESIDTPRVHKGQRIRWEIDSGNKSLEFDVAYGILVENNVHPSGKSYFDDCGQVQGDPRQYECTRTNLGAQGLSFYYSVLMNYDNKGRPQTCYVDPLIVSRD